MKFLSLGVSKQFIRESSMTPAQATELVKSFLCLRNGKEQEQ